MNTNKLLHPSPKLSQYIVAIVIVTVITAAITMGYYFLWDISSSTPIPEPYTLEYVGYQSVFFMVVNGLIHTGFRNKKHLSSFEYLKWLLVLVLANVVVCYITMNIQIIPSINEIKRLYGSDGIVPPVLFSLSVPIAFISALLGMFAIPYFTWRSKRNPYQATIKGYHDVALKLFKAYLIVVGLILIVNLTYYQLYIAYGGEMPQEGFSRYVMIQMAFVLTAIAAMLFLYLRDNSSNGLFIYIVLTGIISYSAFLAGLSRVDGQPLFDNTLWLNIPIAVVSTVGELVGIPYFFKNLMKKKVQGPYRR